MPQTETDAKKQGWRQINEHCGHDLTPGYHYEHNEMPEARLIYDEDEDLVGMERLSAFFYRRSRSDICGTAGTIDFSCQREPFIVANGSDLPLFQYQKEAMVKTLRFNPCTPLTPFALFRLTDGMCSKRIC